MDFDMKGTNDDKSEGEEVRYCVTAITDLLGFSSHLETAGSDLRTTIGREAIKRLELLEHAIRLIAEEKAWCRQEYPETFRHIRLNDAIVFGLDLPDLLKPAVGKSVRNGISAHDLLQFFSPEQFKSEEAFVDAYRARLASDVTDLVLFVGLLARVHAFINRTESAKFFPGARTVIASGYRRPFGNDGPTDFLSANFSFSNAYLAERSLHGSNFYVDNNVSQLISANRFAQNLLRFACYSPAPCHFDPYVDYEDPLSLGYTHVKSEPVDLILFRKSFQFRQLDPYPLAHLQLIPRLINYLEGSNQPAEGGSVVGTQARRTLRAMSDGPASTTEALGGIRLDLEDDIRVFSEIIESGKSPTLNQQIETIRKGAVSPNIFEPG